MTCRCVELPQVYTTAEGDTSRYTYARGVLAGPFEERDARGELRARGSMCREGHRVGRCELFFCDGGLLDGVLRCVALAFCVLLVACTMYECK